MLTNEPVLAHRFNVALILPASEHGRQIREGFMLATTERDSHPDQESDGHLGGLDVYVNVIGGQGDFAAKFRKIAARSVIDIVAVFGSDPIPTIVRKQFDGKKATLLLPGQSPFTKPDLPAVAAFRSAYQKVYGRGPSSQAARGYNMARRIDVAVRAQGGVENTQLLLASFRDTAQGFTW